MVGEWGIEECGTKIHSKFNYLVVCKRVRYKKGHGRKRFEKQGNRRHGVVVEVRRSRRGCRYEGTGGGGEWTSKRHPGTRGRGRKSVRDEPSVK